MIANQKHYTSKIACRFHRLLTNMRKRMHLQGEHVGAVPKPVQNVTAQLLEGK